MRERERGNRLKRRWESEAPRHIRHLRGMCVAIFAERRAASEFPTRSLFPAAQPFALCPSFQALCRRLTSTERARGRSEQVLLRNRLAQVREREDGSIKGSRVVLSRACSVFKRNIKVMAPRVARGQ